MKILGIAAQMAMGKDELAKCLLPKLNFSQPKWQHSAFASAVKKVYMDAFGVDMDYIERWKRVNDPPPGKIKNIRKSLQFIGDGFRQIQSDIWIDIAFRNEGNYIISDSRYVNEAKEIKKRGGFTVLMYRPDYLNNDPNPSEAQLRPLIKWCVDNDIPTGPLDYTYLEESYKPWLFEKLWPKAPPKELKYYDFFFRNDGTLEDLCENAEKFLIPHLNKYFK